jgi:hypothetical protein
MTTPAIQVFAPAVPPAGGEVLTPEVEDHEDEEELDAPEVKAVEEAAGGAHVPPLQEGDGEEHEHPADHDQVGIRNENEADVQLARW